MNRVSTFVPKLVRLSARQFNSTAAKQFEDKPKTVDLTKLKEAQRHFQIPDGKPVYLKGGFKDQLLFGFTVVYAVVLMGFSLEFIYSQMVPAKN